MSKLIPVIYRNMNYPSDIETNIHEFSGNFYKTKLIVKSRYSLHTEPSAVPKTFCSKIINEFKHIKEAQKDNIPQLWRNQEWAYEFSLFIEWLIGSNNPPEVLEIHPPFNDYCSSFYEFMGIFNTFYRKFKRKYPATKIVIENRFGTRYKGGEFLLSTCSDVLNFCEFLSNPNNSDIDLKIVLDYPQLFSAETKKKKKDENWMGSNPALLVERIISFNRDIKKYKGLIGGFHMWGKLRKGNRWIPHAGNFDTFFSNNNELKHMFLSSVFSTFNDDIARYFVPEINSGESDLHSIVDDMKKEGFIFISKKKSIKTFDDFQYYRIKIPEKNMAYREDGFLEKDGWLIQFCFGEKEGKEYMDMYCSHRMTNDSHFRIYEDGTSENLACLDLIPYNQEDKINEIKKILIEKGFYPFPYVNNWVNNM